MKKTIGFVYLLGCKSLTTKYTLYGLESLESGKKSKLNNELVNDLFKRGVKFADLPNILMVEVVGLSYFIKKSLNLYSPNYKCKLYNLETGEPISEVEINLTGKEIFDKCYDYKLESVIRNYAPILPTNKVRQEVRRTIIELNRENKPNARCTVDLPDTYCISRDVIPANDIFDISTVPETLTGDIDMYGISFQPNGIKSVHRIIMFETTEGKRGIAIDNNDKVVTVYGARMSNYQDIGVV